MIRQFFLNIITKSHSFCSSRALLSGLLFVFGAALGGCEKDQDALAEIKERGSIRMATVRGPTTWYENRGSPAGFEFTMASEFAKRLGVELDVSPQYRISNVLEELDRGRVDFAAAGLIATDQRRFDWQLTPSYMQVKNFVVFRRGNAKARKVEDLYYSRIKVAAGSSGARELAELRKQHPQLLFETSKTHQTADLLAELEDQLIDFTVVNSNEYAAFRGFFNQVRVGFAIGEPGKLSWALPVGPKHVTLYREMQQFIVDSRRNGDLANWIERYYGFTDGSQINSQTFLANMRNKLPKYKELIEDVAVAHNIDWRLLAAISYQESLWDPEARSPTGVRGMMMLTRDTAKDLGISNRIDPRQSMEGGARYINQMMSRLPDGIEQPDRTWFAMAAYNVGLGHLYDAMDITEKQGGDKYKWRDVKTRLPLLRDPKYWRSTRYGYARGDEPVRYVQNIRHYYNLLTWTDLERVRKRPPKIVADFVSEKLDMPMLAF